MNECPEQNRNISQISRFLVIANIVPSKSKQTVKIIDINGRLLGIAKRDEILDLLDGKTDRVNVVVYRC
jgi:hypothetical protein